MDRQAEDIHEAVKLRGRGWWGFQLGDPQVWLWGNDELTGGRRRILRDLVVYNKRILGLLKLSEESITEFYRRLKQWRPSYLYGYPSGVGELVRLCSRKKLSLEALKIKGIITTAEILSGSDRHFIQAAFACPVINEYGCAEAQIISFECPEGSMHINADTLRVEFLKEGRPAQPGEIGQIVVTDLFNEVMPLIRYKIGDVGRPKEGSCPCGRTLPLMEISVGREVEMVVLADGRLIHPEIFTPPHRDPDTDPLFELVERFRVIQEAPSRFRIQVITHTDELALIRSRFVNLVESQLGKGIDIQVEKVSEIPRDPSGKLRYFISRIGDSAQSS